MADSGTSDKPKADRDGSNNSNNGTQLAESSPDGTQLAESSLDAASSSADREEQAERPSSSSAESSDGDRDSEEEADGEDEEAGECGFCLFMKSGPCRDSFIKWEECVERAEKAQEDMVDKCHKVTFLLKECMEHNSDYYEPVLQAERAMSEEAESEAAEASHDKEQVDEPPSSADSSERPTDSPAENQHLPESQESPPSVEENPTSK